jgi:hypothetical protein
MLSEANHLTTGMISFCNRVEINEAKMVQCRAKVFGCLCEVPRRLRDSG